MNSDFKSVTEQTGLWAGDGGFLVDVKHNTTLIGSVIASSDKAVADGLNKLTTGTLVTEDLKNTARYSASQVSIGGGFGFGGGGKAGDSGLGTTKDGQVAGGATKEAGSSISTGSGGFGMSLPSVAAASGHADSVTQSGISGGAIVIRDEAGQLALTGKTAAETIASLNRDTSDTLNALKPIFDKEKIEAGFEIVSEAQRQAGQFLTNRAKEIDALKARAKDPTLSQAERDQAAADAKKLEAEWGANGQYRLGLTVIVGAAGGNVMGSAGQFVQSAAASYLQALGASKVKDIADALGSESARVALQGLMGCAGAVGQGGSCSAGAMGAAASVVLNNLIERLSGLEGAKLSAEEKDTHANLVAGLVAGITAALGGESAVSTLAAQIETQSNYFGQKPTQFSASEQEQFNEAMKYCGPGNTSGCARARELAGISEKNDKELASACVVPGSALCRAAVQLAVASGNVVFFDKQGRPTAVPADSPVIQATPDPRDGTFHYTLSASVAEAWAIDATGFALGGTIATLRANAAAAKAQTLQAAKAAGTVAEPTIQVPGRVQSRVNLMTGDKSAGWEHVVNRHFNPEANASQFTIGQSELRTLLQSQEVVGTPITRTLESAQGIRYVREVYLGQPIGVDKFSGQSTSIMTVLTDKFGNLITTTPGLIK